MVVTLYTFNCPNGSLFIPRITQKQKSLACTPAILISMAFWYPWLSCEQTETQWLNTSLYHTDPYCILWFMIIHDISWFHPVQIPISQAGIGNLTIFKPPKSEPFEKQRISGLNSRRMDQVGLKRFEPCPAGTSCELLQCRSPQRSSASEAERLSTIPIL